MASMVIENVEPAVMEGLKESAAERGISLEAEIRRILREAIDPEPLMLTPEIRRIQAMFDDRLQSDSVDLIREDRER